MVVGKYNYINFLLSASKTIYRLFLQSNISDSFPISSSSHCSSY